ncbi:hypothetical protein NOW96_002888 [Vibrio cholerae]|nr:hypothetical protein [Vibrio cholerae]
MINFLRTLILLITLFSNVSLANDPSKDPNAPEKGSTQATPLENQEGSLPTILFRADSRPPYIESGAWQGQGVFEVGFVPLGENTNLYDHVRGESTFSKKSNSNFVAFSRNKYFPWTWGMQSVATSKIDALNINGLPYVYDPDHFYIYAIRPTANIYNMADTYRTNLEYLHQLTGETITNMQNQVANYRHQEEWIGYGHIGVDQIMSVEVWRFHREGEFSGQFRLERRMQNPRFIPAHTFPSRVPLLLQPEDTRLSFLDQVRRVFSTPDGQTYPIAFLSCVSFLHNFWHRGPREIDGSDDLDICPELKYTYVPKSLQIVRNPQNIKVEMKMQVPWYSVYKATNYYNREDYPENCTVEIQDYHLYVRCNATPPYPTSYHLHLGAGGPENTWIDQSCIFSFSEQEENGQFVVNIRDLHVVGSQYALALHDYTIKQAFSGTGGWWSNIRITPIYPVLPDEQPSNCTWNRNH